MPEAPDTLSLPAPVLEAGMSAPPYVQAAHVQAPLPALRNAGLTTHGDSNIVPVMVGDASRAVASAEQVCRDGYWVKAVRPPTVPAGTSRLRLSLNAAMEWEQLAGLPACIAASLH